MRSLIVIGLAVFTLAAYVDGKDAATAAPPNPATKAPPTPAPATPAPKSVNAVSNNGKNAEEKPKEENSPQVKTCVSMSVDDARFTQIVSLLLNDVGCHTTSENSSEQSGEAKTNGNQEKADNKRN